MIRVLNAPDKQNQTLPDHWFGRVSLHHLYIASFTQLGIPVSTVKIFGADIKKIDVWNIVRYQDFLKVIPKATLGSHSHDNMNESAIFGDWTNTERGFCGSPISLR